MIVRQLRRVVLGSTLSTATLAALLWSLTTGSAAAAAATRLRSGTVHAQLASHITRVVNPVPAGLQVQGTGVMAAVVAGLALLALAFVVVTLVRRRITTR